jgi:hypothetical protein
MRSQKREGEGMKKETWIKHIEDTEGLIRPTNGGSKELWHSATARHLADNCPICNARRKQRKRNMDARLRHAAMTDLGLKRVRGNLGGIYYE